MRFLATLALFFLVGPASAQSSGTLAGRVTDAATGETLPGANVVIEGTTLGAATDIDGEFRIIGVPVGTYAVTASYVSYAASTLESVSINSGITREVSFALSSESLGTVVVEYERPMIQKDAIGSPRVVSGDPYGDSSPSPRRSSPRQRPVQSAAPVQPLNIRGGRSEETSYYVDGVRVTGLLGVNQQSVDPRPTDREGYAAVEETGFQTPRAAPLSTFSIDVDRASYANTRRMLLDGYLPPVDAVRVEEFVNAFDYEVPGPDARGDRPFAVHTEVAIAPWEPEHRLVRVALQGRRMDKEELPPMNLVFLIDVSGSMSSADKLELVKSGLRLLVSEMRQEDRIAIVVYAGAAGLVLPPTDGAHKRDILRALERLTSGGSTAGGAGLRLAYQTAKENFDPNATNRVILATDGDFNVGVSSDAEMQRLVEEERASGVFLSVLGVGTGNLQDSKMEAMADHGNGNYSYLDSIREAEKVLVREMGGTLVALAKDVKIQVEFNPTLVQSYRLIGYENRRLQAEDFNDDRKDAGELGAGHSVTALYEIIPIGAASAQADIDDLRYQRSGLTDASASGELLTVKLRYKPATGPGTFSDTSVKMDVPVQDVEASGVDRASEAMRWAVAVTEGALLMRQSEYVPGASFDHALRLARRARGQDPHGDRAEFIRLLETAHTLTTLRDQRHSDSDPQARAD